MKSQSHYAKATRDKSIKEKIKKLPDTPGVYFFLRAPKRGEGGKPKILYIGKATSLRDRVRSYFSGNIELSRGPLISRMLSEFSDVAFQKTDSVLEALILEANLIKTHQPEANIRDKDNKSFNFVVITKEDFPRVLVMRGRELDTNTEGGGLSFSKTFGPFPNGSQLKEAMKIVRRMFPYRDKCTPAPHPAYGHPPLDQGREDRKNKLVSRAFPHLNQGEGYAKRRVGLRPCFNRQIGLCPGVCTGEISKEDYAKQIKNIILFFEGNKIKLIKSLKSEMKDFAKRREFEKANGVKRQIFALYHIQDVSLIKSEKLRSISLSEKTFRIESYDVAHLSGTNVVGVMTVVENGELKKSDYRKFKIKYNPGIDDTGALAEILTRRLNHMEWPLPNLVVVDGGVAQKRAMEKILKENNLNIPIVGVVKDKYHKPREILGIEKFKEGKIKNLEEQILMANAEAHRFAIGFHKQQRSRSLIPGQKSLK